MEVKAWGLRFFYLNYRRMSRAFLMKEDHLNESHYGTMTDPHPVAELEKVRTQFYKSEID